MDLYEHLVQTYLTVFDHFAVLPRFPVLFDQQDRPRFHETSGRQGWAAYPDFLAIDTRCRLAQIIEANKSSYPNQINQLVQRALANRAKVEEYAKWFLPGGFELHWRFFIRGKLKDRLKTKLDAGGLDATISPLEEVFDKLKDVMP